MKNKKIEIIYVKRIKEGHVALKLNDTYELTLRFTRNLTKIYFYNKNDNYLRNSYNKTTNKYYVLNDNLIKELNIIIDAFDDFYNNGIKNFIKTEWKFNDIQANIYYFRNEEKLYDFVIEIIDLKKIKEFLS